jgi:RNA polymerase primary sigma factor
VVNRIASENIALVHHIARQFRSRTIEHEDLVGEGMLGLIEGAQRFDASKGSKVGTYLGFWIRARIFRAMQADAGATNEHERKVVFNIYKAVRKLEGAGLEASPENIAGQIGVAVEWVTKIFRRNQAEVRLDANIRQDGRSRTFAEVLGDPAMCTPASAEDDCLEAQAAAFDRESIERALGMMREREATILRLRFLSSEEGMHLQEIGDMWGISRERIRQLEKRALKRMRVLLQAQGAGR